MSCDLHYDHVYNIEDDQQPPHSYDEDTFESDRSKIWMAPVKWYVYTWIILAKCGLEIQLKSGLESPILLSPLYIYIATCQ